LPTLGLWLVQGGGGGDVKLGAAIGACAGLRAGFEIWLVSLVIAALFALGWLAWEGKLPQTLRNTFFLALNPMLPKQRRSAVRPSQMSTVRMGGAFLAATVLSLLIRHPSLAP
jgi:prepilin peptidase CpaA